MGLLYIPSLAEILEVSRSRGQLSDAPDLWTGLAGAWPMQEGGGTTAQDVSGYGNTATLTGGVSWAVSKFGHLVSFVGTGDDAYIELASRPGSLTTGWHFGCWFNLTDIASRRTILHYSEGDYDLAVGWRDNELRASLYDWNAESWIWKKSTAWTTLNEWHRIDVIANASDGSLYVNGVAATGTNQYTSIATRTAGTRFGTFRETGGNRYGWVGDLALYGFWSTRETSRIAQLYSDPWAMYRLRPVMLPVAVAPAAGAIMNQFQRANLGADLFNGTMLGA